MLSLCLRHCSNGLKKSTFNLVPRRNFFFQRKKSEHHYRMKDHINDSFVMIYRAPMEHYIPFCNLITSASVVFLGGYLIYRCKVAFFSEIIDDVPKQLEIFNTGTIVMADNEIIFAVIGMVLLSIAMKLVVWKYPLRIYKNGHDYISIFEGNIPYTRSKLNFMKGEVKELTPNKFTENLLPWTDSKYTMKDRTAILLYPNFRTPADLHQMMQPIKPKTAPVAKKK